MPFVVKISSRTGAVCSHTRRSPFLRHLRGPHPDPIRAHQRRGAGRYHAVRVEFADGQTQWMTMANAQGARRFDVFDEAASFPREE